MGFDVRGFRLVVFDLDGTLYRGQEAIPHAVEAVARLRKAGIGVRFTTNNATQTREFFTEKLTKMGFRAANSEVETSATTTAAYLVDRNMQRVGAFGEAGLIKICEAAGLTVFGPDDDWPEDLDVVAAGLFRQFNYAHVNKALQAILTGATFVATNRDPTLPLEGGSVIPGSGAGVAAIAAASGQEPATIGKPSPALIERAMKSFGATPSETLVVGDRMDTDIVAGAAAGCPTLMVLTGVTTAAPKGQPTIDDLSAENFITG